MSGADILKAEQFVASLKLPDAPVFMGAKDVTQDSTSEFLDKAKDQAAIVGSDVISFVKGITEDKRRAILDSSLLAQLVAKKRVGDPAQVYDWYDAYFDVLSNIGWVIQDRGFAEYAESSQGFAAHEAILQIATGLLGPGTTTLAVVKATLDGLKSLKEDSPWITLFNRESQHANTARFQVSLAHEDENKDFFVSLMAFGLEANAKVTQVLFFKFRSNNAQLRHLSGKVTINSEVLTSVQPRIAGKIAAFQDEFIRGLPEIG